MRIEIKILVGLCVAAVVAAILIPNMLSAKISWNDVSALGRLRNLVRAQEEFRERRIVDLDGDGRGEYGTFGELSGADGVRADPEARGRGAPLAPALQSTSFSWVDDRGLASRSGYLFRVLLPGKGGAPVREGRASAWSGGTCPKHGPCPGPPDRPPCATCRTPPPRVREPGTAFSGPVDADAAERSWCAYAWPAQDYGELKGESRFHHRVFFADADGRIWQAWNRDRRYCGADRAPSWDAAMPEDGLGLEWASAAAGFEEYRGRDGNVWMRVK